MADAMTAEWWGCCPVCWGAINWFGDTEEEVRELVESHMAAENHGARVWYSPRASSGEDKVPVPAPLGPE